MFSASFSNSGVGGGMIGAALGAASLVGSVAMAATPTFVSLIASGTLSVTTDKPYYVSGDLIQGVVTANIVQPISCRRIVVQVVGQEKVEINRLDTEWVDQGQGQPRRAVHYVRRYRNRRYFFNLSIPVYDLQNGTLMPGNYTFPFQYQLPDGLPGSFFERQELEHLPPGVIYEDAHPQHNHHHHHNSYQGAVADFGDSAFCDSDDELGAVVQNRHGLAQYRRPRLLALVHYKLRVVLDVNGFFAPDLRAKRAIIIHPRLGAEVKPAFAERHTDVMVCCCINKGRCGLSVHFDRNAYCPGERANIMAKLENQSTKPLRLQIRLMRKLEVTTQGHHLGSHREESQVLYQEVEGAPAGETVERPMPLNLPGDLRPTTIGEFVKCTYTYVVTAKVSWGSDIKLVMPVTLYAPQPNSF